MNYVMGDFGFFSDFSVDSILNAGKTWISDPKNQQQVISAGVNLVAPKPKPAAPKPVTTTTSTTAAAGQIQKKDNTLLYVGLGVSGVVVAAVIAGIVMAKKK
jgi:hypothetical protein